VACPLYSASGMPGPVLILAIVTGFLVIGAILALWPLRRPLVALAAFLAAACTGIAGVATPIPGSLWVGWCFWWRSLPSYVRSFVRTWVATETNRTPVP